jgi:ESCRT-II complex subunit VPS36
MEFLEGGALTGAGRAQLAEGETQVAGAAGVSLQDRGKQTLPLPEGARAGQLVVTTHFLWWWPEPVSANTRPVKLGLQRVLKAELHSSLFRSTPRIDLYFAKDPSEPLLRVCFSGKEAREVFDRLQTSLAREGWKAPKAVVQREEGFATHLAGVGGVIRRQEAEREQTKALSTEAFSDLTALLQAAGEIVKLADRFSAALRSAQEQRQLEGGAERDEEEEGEFYSLLNDMGIANPATKRACGSRFHEELARELADLLDKQLKRHCRSGVIALTDLYCLVNRARGTELISPNDLFQACSQMERLGLRYTLKTFNSGVQVLQAASMSDDTVTARLIDLINTNEKEAAGNGLRPFITSQTVATHMGISLQLAKEKLLIAESSGHLCRDETVQGLAFYRNIFAQFV